MSIHWMMKSLSLERSAISTCLRAASCSVCLDAPVEHVGKSRYREKGDPEQAGPGEADGSGAGVELGGNLLSNDSEGGKGGEQKGEPALHLHCTCRYGDGEKQPDTTVDTPATVHEQREG